VSRAANAPLELWGGVECTVNRVGARWFDQVAMAGHHRRDDDLDRFAALGLRTLRYPVLWEHLAPDSPHAIDWRSTDARLERLRGLGIRPIVGLLHHGSGPRYTSLLDRRFPEQLARFARAVAERYPWVVDFTPVNEPLTTARFSGLYGHWYPHRRNDRDFVRALLNQTRATVLAMRAIRDVNSSARLIQTEDCGRAYGTAATVAQVTHEGHRRWLTWDLLTGLICDDHPLLPFLRRAGMTADDEAFLAEAQCPPDILGLNYYLTSDRYLDDRLERYPEATRGTNGVIRYADVEAVRGHPEGIAGHRAHLLAAWNRYHRPLAITEVHLGCTREEQMRWLMESWDGAVAARAAGADVRAVTAWALLGSHDWDSLVTRERGHYEPGVFDIRGPAPRPTAIAAMVASLARGRRPHHPVLAGRPWWRRPDRTPYGVARTAKGRSRDAAPLLVIGATGTLGRAFQRIAAQRGLACRLVGRRDVDITDPTRIDAIVRRLEPWAVINAAGYVRVDDAERDVEACRRANVTGPINLAAACRRHGLPLVTFSSDLVFDGRADRPYLEDDEPRPLNVYGATKAEAERRVLELLPAALVIRTSAFFGPWDAFNFLACLFRALDQGASFKAAEDSTVSPTYVPDLVQASLDLLIDGETGLWHVVNDGAVTWLAFAQTAADRTGRPAHLIEAVPSEQAWGAAARPRFSALASARGQLPRSLDRALDAYLDDVRAARTATGTDVCVSR
jgi:dTDP-4-dehydrorhamnose reductase